MNFDEENLKVLSRSAGDDRAMLADDVLEARAKVRGLETKNKLMTIRLKAIIETLDLIARMANQSILGKNNASNLLYAEIRRLVR